MRRSNFPSQHSHPPKPNPFDKQVNKKPYQHEYGETPQTSKGPADVNHPYNCYLRACSYEKQGDFDNALIEFKKSVRPGQKNPNFNSVLGNFYIKMVKRMTDKESPKYYEALDNALRHLKEAEQIQSQYGKNIYPERTWNGIADVYLLKGDNTKAHEYYNKGIEENAHDWYGYNGKGELYQNQGEFDQARKYFEKAKECFSNKIETHKEVNDEKAAERDEILGQLEEKIAKCVAFLALEPAKQTAKSEDSEPPSSEHQNDMESKLYGD